MRRKKYRNHRHFRRLNLLDLLLILLILVGIANNRNPKNNDFQVVIPSERSSFGIDVSHHQGAIKWDTLLSSKTVTPSIDFVFIKATEGINWIDVQWENNRNALRQNGVRHGAYHFYKSNVSATKQAHHFLSVWKPKSEDLPPVLDVEIKFKTASPHADSIKSWMHTIENTTGFRPIIYCSLHDYRSYYRDLFTEYQFWVAAYSQQLHLASMSNVIYWQFAEDATLPLHRNKLVDVNVCKIPFD
ncbi:MAG: glycoside hydrolase family 25 protein [Bacteroidota bacterium]